MAEEGSLARSASKEHASMIDFTLTAKEEQKGGIAAGYLTLDSAGPSRSSGNAESADARSAIMHARTAMMAKT